MNRRPRPERVPIGSVPLSAGEMALVDASDHAAVMLFTWTTARRRHTVYAVRQVRACGQKGNQLLHRFVWALMGGGHASEIDHVNGNGLDCRRSNLRAATRAQNEANKGVPRSNSSGFKGVTWDRERELWQAQIKVGGRKRYLGRYADPTHAARSYDAAALEHFGEYARTNAALGLLP